MNDCVKSYSEYAKLNKTEKENFLRDCHEKAGMSWPQIAEMLGTYVNKIRRDSLKFGISGRSRSEAQKNALKKGRTQHPTEGKVRTVKEKEKIGAAVAQKWEDLSPEEKAARAQKSKETWALKTEEEKEALKNACFNAVRKTAVHGSRLEKFMFKGLTKAGYEVHFHKERFVKNEKLHIDLLLPELAIAIEIDGPSHWSPVWGEEAFERTVRSDNMKNGLLIAAGFFLIRVEQRKRWSLTYQNYLLEETLKVIEKICTRKIQDKLIYIS